jgi:hypothetical protein
MTKAADVLLRVIIHGTRNWHCNVKEVPPFIDYC